MFEEWKVIPDEPNYSVSNFGRIRNNTTRNIRKFTECPGSRYAKLHVGRPPHRKHYAIHRLVANAFIPNPENKPEINHINGNKYDNRVSNLEWCTHSENMKHATHNDLCPLPPSVKTKVVLANSDNVVLAVYDSVKEASKATGVSINTIYCTLSQQNHKPVNGNVWLKLDRDICLTTSENVSVEELLRMSNVELK